MKLKFKFKLRLNLNQIKLKLNRFNSQPRARSKSNQIKSNKNQIKKSTQIISNQNQIKSGDPGRPQCRMGVRCCVQTPREARAWRSGLATFGQIRPICRPSQIRRHAGRRRLRLFRPCARSPYCQTSRGALAPRATPCHPVPPRASRFALDARHPCHF